MPLDVRSAEPALPPAVLREISSPAYSARLYGEENHSAASGSLQVGSSSSSLADTARIVWPYLLSAEANRSLLGATYHLCLTHGELKWIQQSARFRFRFLYMDKVFLSHSALWLHQPEPPPPPRDNEFIEVTHCYYRNRVAHIDRYSPMWFYHAPGSGVWLSVGRRYLVDETAIGARLASLLRNALVKGFGSGAAPGTDKFVLSFARLMQEHSLMNATNASTLDSVVFPLRSPVAWGGERLTEVVSLRAAGRETQHLDGIISGGDGVWQAGTRFVSCGRPPSLRMCVPNEPAMVVHGGICAQQLQHPMFDLLRASKNCSLAGEEEAGLRLALKDRRIEEGAAPAGWSAHSKAGAELRWTSSRAE